MDTFAKTPFSKQLIKGLTDSFESPTPIQVLPNPGIGRFRHEDKCAAHSYLFRGAMHGSV